MKSQLQILDNNLRTLRPECYSSLNEPLTEEEIKHLEEKYGIALPEDLKLLYMWKNGQDVESYESFVNNSTFMPLEEVLSSASEMTDMIGADFEIENWWNENWLPIFHNGGGDHICYDMEGTFTSTKGQLIEFWHADSDRNVIAPSLKAFIEAINEFYKDKSPEEFDKYFQIDDIEGYPESFYVE